MNNSGNYIVNKYILKIVGVFHFNKEFYNNAINNGYHNLINDDFEKNYYKDTYYPDVRKVMFLNETNQHKVIKKIFQAEDIVLKHEFITSKQISLKIIDSRIDLFENEFGLFSINLKINKEDILLTDLSDASFLSRGFDNIVMSQKEVKWHQYIENKILLNQSTRGEGITIDDYSGSKYKTYLILDSNSFENNTTDSRNFALADLSTFNRIGTSESNDNNSFSDAYQSKIKKQGNISIFNGWTGQALLDSYTVVGDQILANENAIKTYDKTYFTIYIYCLYLKYTLFKYNYEISDFDEDKREHFGEFIKKYYFPYISYNFLPTEIFNSIREGLDIEKELVIIENKIKSIGESIQEDQQKRTNKILGIVSVITAIPQAIPVWDKINEIEKQLNWNPILFWSLMITLLLTIGIYLIVFIFGKKQVLKWKNRIIGRNYK
jgi:hypothetical protein